MEAATQQAQFPANPSALPDSWIAKIFDHMAALYGSKFADLWRNTDLALVRKTWAEKLSGFMDKPLAIKQALDALDSRPWPPTLPEFIELCRDAAKRIPAAAAGPALAFKADPAKARAAIASASRTVKPADKLLGDPLAWARRPASRIAFDAIRKIARDDPQMAAVVAELAAAGHVVDGRLVHRWLDGGWVKA